MPHLDVVSYLTQYMWALFALLSLFPIMGLGIFPIFQRQLVAWVRGSKVFQAEKAQTPAPGGIVTFILQLHIWLWPSLTHYQ